MTITLEQRQLIKDAIAAQFGEEASEEMVDQVLGMPKIKVFTGALKAYQTTDGQRVFRCTASSTITDLHGDDMTEVCVRDMAAQAKRGPAGKGLTIFLNHSYKVPEDVAGKVIDTAILTREKNADGLDIWDMDYNVLLRSKSSRIDELWSLIHDDEITLGISIGAYILEYDYKDKEAGFWGGLIINKVLLVETSVVGIPANQRSWVQNAVISIGKSLGIEERQIKRVLDRKEAAPMTIKNADANAIVEPFIELPADGSPVEVTLSADEADTTDTNAPEAPEVTEEEVAEAAPIQESPAEQTTESDPDEDGETTEAAAPALESVAPEIALSISEGKTPEMELVLSAFEAAAKELRATRTRNAELETEVKALTERVEKADQDVKDAAEIIELVAKSPLGRKTQFAGPVQTFSSKFGHIYSQRFLNLMDETE